MAVPAFVGSDTQDKAGGLDLTFNLTTAGAGNGDFMICFVKQCENTTQRTWDDDGGGGNGWTREVYNRTTSGRDMECAIYWKFHDGSETNPTFTWASGITAEPMSGILLVYSGVDTISPFTEMTYANATNDANPPNPNVRVDFINTRVVCFHGATHDDISTTAAPTGFTMRDEVWNGTANDHRNCFAADIEIDTIGDYSPPDWQHSVLNTTPEYQTYSIGINEAQPVHITDVDTDEEITKSQTNVVVTGDGFEARQGTGKLELWSDTSGTIKVTQTIDSWSDTSIQFDTVQGTLTDGVVYVVVTNDSAEASGPFPIAFGLPPYTDIIEALSPDHYWKFNNTYNDTGITGPTRNATSGVVGTQIFVTTLIAEDTTHAWELNGVTDRREIADSPNMNITINSAERTVCSWIQLGGIQQSFGAIWKEGGGVQNLAFLVGMGNVLMAQLADVAATRDNVQAFSDFRLKADRPYHICMRYTHTETPREFRLYIDGIEQAVTDGNPMTLGTFDSHSGDVTWGDPDNNLETGGTDIAYAGQTDCLLAHFATWSDNSASSGALNKTTEIYAKLFERGAIPDDTISTGTESAMQTSMDSLADSVRPDWPLAIRVEEVSGGGDLELLMDNITFDPGVTLQVQYLGGDTLTLVTQNGTILDTDKFSTPAGGTITVVPELIITFTVREFDGTAIENARVYIEAGAGGSETEGDVLLNGLTNASGVASFTFRYSVNQPIIGRARKATTTPFFKTTGISATILSTGLLENVFLIPDE